MFFNFFGWVSTETNSKNFFTISTKGRGEGVQTLVWNFPLFYGFLKSRYLPAVHANNQSINNLRTLLRFPPVHLSGLSIFALL